MQRSAGLVRRVFGSLQLVGRAVPTQRFERYARLRQPIAKTAIPNGEGPRLTGHRLSGVKERLRDLGTDTDVRRKWQTHIAGNALEAPEPKIRMGDVHFRMILKWVRFGRPKANTLWLKQRPAKPVPNYRQLLPLPSIQRHRTT